MTLPRILMTKGGSVFEAYSLSSTRLGLIGALYTPWTYLPEHYRNTIGITEHHLVLLSTLVR